MCLKACRRLPLNAPCVSLRLTSCTPEEVKKEATMALLSGGAHPILFHDDKMVQGGCIFMITIRNVRCMLHESSSCYSTQQDSMKYYVSHLLAQMYQSQEICSRLPGVILVMDAMSPCFPAGASLNLHTSIFWRYNNIISNTAMFIFSRFKLFWLEGNYLHNQQWGRLPTSWSSSPSRRRNIL